MPFENPFKPCQYLASSLLDSIQRHSRIHLTPFERCWCLAFNPLEFIQPHLGLSHTSFKSLSSINLGMFILLTLSCHCSCSSMAPRPDTCHAQVTFGGLGKHFESPQRPRDKHKTQQHVEIAGHSAKCHRLAAHLEQLHSEVPCSPPSIETFADQLDDEFAYENHFDSNDQEFILSNSESHQVVGDTQLLEATSGAQSLVRKCVLPDIFAEHLCSSWKTIIPTLIQPYLQYVAQTLGKPLPLFSLAIALCGQSQCTRKPVNILCLLFNRKFP